MKCWICLLASTVLLFSLTSCSLLTPSSCPELHCKEAPECNQALSECEADLDQCLELGKDCHELLD